MPKYYSPTPEEIRALRAKLNYTQAEMADLLMCSPNSIAKWEQGVNSMIPVIWNAVQIVVSQATQKEKKLTVYEQKQLDKQAEAEKLAQQEERYKQRIAAREQEEMDRREALMPRFEELMDTLKLRFGRQIKEFEQCEASHELDTAIMHMEKLYAQFKDEVDAMNNGTYVEPTRNMDDSDSLDDWFK